MEKWYSVSENFWQGSFPAAALLTVKLDPSFRAHAYHFASNLGMEASDKGMLDGFEATSPADVRASEKFIQPFFDGVKEFNLKIAPTRCIDVGAGIGRITKLFLAQHFGKVDLLEQSQAFLDKAKEDLTSATSEVAAKIGEFYCAPLQTFEFPVNVKYDVIWIQWVLLYLLDVDLVTFLKRCKAALQPNGVIIIKENVTRDGYYVDNADCSITRSVMHFKSVFATAGLKLLREDDQAEWPKELFPVKMFALL